MLCCVRVCYGFSGAQKYNIKSLTQIKNTLTQFYLCYIVISASFLRHIQLICTRMPYQSFGVLLRIICTNGSHILWSSHSASNDIHRRNYYRRNDTSLPFADHYMVLPNTFSFRKKITISSFI